MLRSLFGGEDDEEKEAEAEADADAEMDDTELNEIISVTFIFNIFYSITQFKLYFGKQRNDEELALYNQIDADRKKQELAAWRAQGGRGDPPPRLMTDEELPAVYLVDPTIKETVKHVELGRGNRNRKSIAVIS